MNWLADLSMKRNVMRSNVFLLETFDGKRLDRFRAILKDKEDRKKLFPKIDFTNVIEWDLQRDEMMHIESGEQIEPDLMCSRMKQLDKKLATQSTIVMMHYVFDRTHSAMIQDFLAAWAHDDRMDKLRSTVGVFTAETMLFNENLRRLCYEITIPPSTSEERKVILERTAEMIEKEVAEALAKKIKLKVTDEIINASAGLDLTSTETAAMQGFYETRKSFKVSAFTECKIAILNTYDIEYIQPKNGYETIGGIQSFKDLMRRNVIKPFKNPEIAKFYGLDPPRGIIAIGPPGTGKTVVAKATAYELGIPMASINTSTLLRGIVGESEARTKQVFNLIESLAPIVLFWDELDEIATPRENTMQTDSGVQRRTVNAILDRLGNRDRKTYVIGCTNFAGLDRAFTRPGRFDWVVPIFYPNREGRLEILNIHCCVLRKIPIDPESKDAIFADMAARTFTFSGADLEKLCKDAATSAMNRDAKKVTLEDFDEALKSMEINVDQRIQESLSMATAIKRMQNVHVGFLKEALKEFIQGERPEQSSKFSGIVKTLSDDFQVDIQSV